MKDKSDAIGNKRGGEFPGLMSGRIEVLQEVGCGSGKNFLQPSLAPKGRGKGGGEGLWRKRGKNKDKKSGGCPG